MFERNRPSPVVALILLSALGLFSSVASAQLCICECLCHPSESNDDLEISTSVS